jgi:two-component system clock-associated histidine kinase SasA
LSIGRHVDQRPNLQRGDLRDCIDQALHEILPFAEEKRIDISVDVRPCAAPLFFERSQMEQVLVNLLDNACKFTPKYGSIVIRGYPYFWERRVAVVAGHEQGLDRRLHASREPNTFRVDIQDSGPGIPAEHLPRIFEEYTTYGGGQDRSGGGLGLAICKLIMARHNGRVWAESNPAGALFSFVLPLPGSEYHPEERNPDYNYALVNR